MFPIQVDFPLKLPAKVQCLGLDILVSGSVLESFQERKIVKLMLKRFSCYNLHRHTRT